jgi:AcrR family transcriptional regulator
MASAQSPVTVVPAADTPRVGRPRATPRSSNTEPRQEILDAAAKLFSDVGYAATTTREIAEAVSLRQGSLFHYFARKDDILAELLDRTLDPAMTFLTRLGRADEPADLKLFTLVRRDVENLCSGATNLGSLQLLPEVRGPRFDGFWAKRERLHAGYGKLVRRGVSDGSLQAGDLELATDVVFGLAESVITWFERGGRRSADEVAVAVAGAAMRTLGVTPRRITTLVSRSTALLATLQ